MAGGQAPQPTSAPIPQGWGGARVHIHEWEEASPARYKTCRPGVARKEQLFSVSSAISSIPSPQQRGNAQRGGKHRNARAGCACSPTPSLSSTHFPRTSRDALHFYDLKNQLQIPILLPQLRPRSKPMRTAVG